MTGVSIIGVGLHKFGMTPAMSGRQQGVLASRAALADAGIGWDDVQFATGGSLAAGTADTQLNDLVPTTIPFIKVLNGCATGGSALAVAAGAIRSGDADRHRRRIR